MGTRGGIHECGLGYRPKADFILTSHLAELSLEGLWYIWYGLLFLFRSSRASTNKLETAGH